MGPKDCARCQIRGKPENYSSDPVCAFSTDRRVFQVDNWNCATLNELRNIAEETESRNQTNIHYSNDQTLMIIPVGHIVCAHEHDLGSFLTLSIYKRRGKVDNAILIAEKFHALRLSEAECVINYYQSNQKGSRP